MNRYVSLGGLAMVAVLAAGACGGANLTPPTTPTPVPQAEIFSGTLNPNGAATHPFTSQAGGTVTATLTTVDPNVVIGMSLGTWNGISCQVVIANDAAVITSVVTGTA